MTGFDNQGCKSKINLTKNFQIIFDAGGAESNLFDLPIRRGGKDFLENLECLFDTYKSNVSSLFYVDDDFRSKYAGTVRKICGGIIKSVEEFLNGKENNAYNEFDSVFQELMKHPLLAYDGKIRSSQRFNLYRVRKVDENRIYARNEIFHTPFNLRNKIATSRYSISGYPSLYLSSSVSLCLKELERENNLGRYIVSRFEIADEECLKIFDLGLKPSDFINRFNEAEAINKSEMKDRQKLIQYDNFHDEELLEKYILWYPLIAACSFMRLNRKDPFAVEYIIPQLLMQHIRNYEKNGENVYGIRYFSCASEFASDMGFNYVFPTNYTDSNSSRKSNFCNNLNRAFKLTAPVLLEEYESEKDMILDLERLKTAHI